MATAWVLPHAYDEHGSCKNIQAWLLDTVDNDIDTFNLLRAWLAALIRGLPLQYILMLIGPGGTGKSVFQRLAIATIGELNTATSTLQALEGNPFETAKHYGKSLCLINEAGRFNGQLNMLKAMSGRDQIPLERKRQQQNGSFNYGGLILLATNDDITSSDSGIERRRVAVRFSKRVSAEQRKDWHTRGGEEAVLHLEIPGLIRWLLEMPVDDIYHAFEILPDRVTEENFLGMRAGSSVADWALDECFFDPEVYNQIGQYKPGAASCDHLYPAYRRWCEENGRSNPVASNRFKSELFEVAARLDHQLVDAKNENRQTIIYGVCLKSCKTMFPKVPSVPSVPTNSEALEGTEGTNGHIASSRNSEWLADYDRSSSFRR